MEALGYLAFSAALYLTLRFFRTVFTDYIFNPELYAPAALDEAADEPKHERLHSCQKQAC